MSLDHRPSLSTESMALGVLAVLAAVLAIAILVPYLSYVLIAIVLAYVLDPFQRRLERFLPATVAACAIVALGIVALVIPVVYVISVAVLEILEFASLLGEGGLDVEVVRTQLETTGLAAEVPRSLEAYRDPLLAGAQGVATGTLVAIGVIPSALIGFTVTGFVLFSLLRDGDRLVAWLEASVPIGDEIQREFRAALDELMWASVVGNVVVAGIQSLLIGLGLFVVGVPGVAFLTVATFLATLLPMIGSFVVWAPISAYLYLVDRPIAAVALFGYGVLVSLSDFYLRPALIGRESELNASVVVVGMFGGLVVFGAVGLFVGPVVLGGAKVAIDIYARERAE